jgi:hypothetical protein
MTPLHSSLNALETSKRQSAGFDVDQSTLNTATSVIRGGPPSCQDGIKPRKPFKRGLFSSLQDFVYVVDQSTSKWMVLSSIQDIWLLNG